MIESIAIAGTGTMGASMAQVCAGRGYKVYLYGRAESSLEKGRRLIAVSQDLLVEQGVLTQARSEEIVSRIELTTALECMGQADIISENILENLESKLEFFRKIDPLVKEGCIVTTNTSGLSINAIAEGVSRKENFAGMHWVNPPHLMPLVEIIRADKTAKATTEAIAAFLRSLGKEPVLVQKDAPGFVLNRLQFAIVREALHIVESGIASAEDVDAAFKYGLGIRYACCGPFETIDLGGVDTFSAITKYLFRDLDDSKAGSPFLASLVERGRTGVKSGAGIYDYSGGRAEEAIRARDAKLLKVTEALFGKK